MHRFLEIKDDPRIVINGGGVYEEGEARRARCWANRTPRGLNEGGHAREVWKVGSPSFHEGGLQLLVLQYLEQKGMRKGEEEHRDGEDVG